MLIKSANVVKRDSRGHQVSLWRAYQNDLSENDYQLIGQFVGVLESSYFISRRQV